MTFRVGLGKDSHRFCSDGQMGMVIGGVQLMNEPKMVANSDGDVVYHAVFNAVSSAIGEGSISLTADKMCLEKGITDSGEYLLELMKKVGGMGFEVTNLSIVIEALHPKIEPIVGAMKNNLGRLLKISVDRIGVTATSGEGLSSFGRGEGVLCEAVVMVAKS